MRSSLKVFDSPAKKRPSQAEVTSAAQSHKDGDLKKALAAYKKLRKKYPTDPHLSFLEELVLAQQIGWSDDLPHLNDVLVGNKGLAIANRALGGYLLGLLRYEEAEKFLLRAEGDFRQNALFHYHLGAALNNQEKFEAAENWLKQSLDLDPNFAPTYFELGNLYQTTERIDLSETFYRKAIALDGDFFEAICNLGGTLYKMMRHQEALACFNRCMEINWDDHSVKGRTALTMMSFGKLPDAWKLYEYALPAGDRTKRNQLEIPKPRWNNHDLNAKGILIWPEQGIGDNIRFASCLQELADRARNVIVVTEIRLAPLFQRSFPSIRVIASDQETFDLEDFDYHLPIGSLPLYFRPTQKDFPDRQRFLTTDPEAVIHWKKRLADIDDNLKVGICWESQLQTAENKQHFCTIDKWKPILEVPGATFINLQYNMSPEQVVAENERQGTNIVALDDIDLYNDLDNLAALEEALDLVITVGTSISDFAGSVGTECWTLLMDWCPDLLGTKKLLWYPNTRVFTRHWDDPWEKILQRVARALTEKLSPPTKTSFDAPVSRNAPCPCGSGKRYKHCCGAAR